MYIMLSSPVDNCGNPQFLHPRPLDSLTLGFGRSHHRLSPMWRAILLLLCLAPAAAPAQNAADRAALGAWDDSLRQVTDLSALRRLESDVGRGQGVDGLRRALYAERHGELAGSRPEIELAISSAN